MNIVLFVNGTIGFSKNRFLDVYVFNRNTNAQLYLPSTFQTSDIELPNPKLKLNIHLTKSPKRDHIYIYLFYNLYTLEEHKCLILTS